LLQVSGFADAGYTSASQASAVGAAGSLITAGPLGVFPYVFDTQNQQIQFHNFNLQAAYNGPIGGKVEASFGDDANIINSYPKSEFAPNTDIDLTQAYVSGTAGVFTGIVGKFETLAGAEVIESPSDLNFSRSILDGFAEPFTHTGGRLTWAYNSSLSLIFGMNKGWDTTNTYKNMTNLYPDTSALTFEGGAAWNPSKAVSWTLQGYSGQVEEGSAVAPPSPWTPAIPARPQRSLVDTVFTVHPSSALTLTFSSDVGQQTNTLILNGVGTPYGYGTATWSGVDGYINYAFNSVWSATARTEYLADFGGSRTGITQRWGEATLTLQYAPSSNVIIRGEVRGDLSNQLFFVGNTGSMYHQNSQFGIETIVKWP
jgi:hypothetical protein